jgi:uncharacterized MAPEG superfamily protein
MHPSLSALYWLEIWQELVLVRIHLGLLGDVTNRQTETMNAVAGVCLVLRVVYTALYINTTTQKKSYLRSLIWGASVLTLMGVYIRAGSKWAAGR